MPAKGLNPRQQLFVSEYLKDHNATQAAERAGYSAKTARQVGSENLSKPAIRAAIDREMNRVIAKNTVTVDEIVIETNRYAFRDLSNAHKAVSADDARVSLKALEILGKYKRMFTDGDGSSAGANSGGGPPIQDRISGFIRKSASG